MCYNLCFFTFTVDRFYCECCKCGGGACEECNETYLIIKEKRCGACGCPETFADLSARVEGKPCESCAEKYQKHQRRVNDQIRRCGCMCKACCDEMDRYEDFLEDDD